MSTYEQFPNQYTHGVTSKFSDLEDDDLNYEVPTLSTSKYYSTQELAKLKISKQFNIFHTNINGLENKFEILHEFITNATYDFDIIGITETSQKCTENFISNVSINNYNLYTTSSNSIRGGSAIYIKDNLDNFERNDLKSQSDEFEAVWVEIKNKNSKNIICGCIYRHPHHE